MQITSNFDGGNIVVSEVRKKEAVLAIRPDLHTDYRQWFCFRCAAEPRVETEPAPGGLAGNAGGGRDARRVVPEGPSEGAPERWPPQIARFHPEILYAAQVYRIDPDLIAAVLQQESGGRPDAVGAWTGLRAAVPSATAASTSAMTAWRRLKGTTSPR